MDRNRPWRRLVSLFHRRRRNDSFHHRRINRRLVPPGRSQEFQANPGIFRLLELEQNLGSSHCMIAQNLFPYRENAPTNMGSFRNPFGGNLDGFTPKCLTNVNYQGLLTGEETFDNFSSSCWLEDHLHDFGLLNDNRPENEDSSLYTPETDSSSFMEENQETGSPFTRSRGLSQLGSHLNENENVVDFFRSAARHSDVDNTNALSVHSGSVSDSRGSTISDVTHFYNYNINLIGLPMDEQPPPYTELPEAPPYTGLPEEPPPSYNAPYIPIIEGRRPSNAFYRASGILGDHLW